ncbi:uncharacterized protein LOC105177630 [Sesamum indicum]|uniref:Uncharacterized protein LOC105177630 n=1 Tax=Sesamum indicum TaxID=4182 RepID=A0A6I9UDE6_SESIN|nr:uncharacterized protein LOC105177630 [Sesamum indicum]
MACLEMYNQNSEHKGVGVGVGVGAGAPPIISPRISFSNDFADSSHSHSHSHSHSRTVAAAYRDAPVSSDFEFSVSNYSMMSADELFFKGRLLPLKESSCSSSKTTTLRDELQNEEDESDDFSLRPPKNPTRWRGFLGLRKSHIGSKKPEKTNERSVEKRTGFHHDDVQCSKTSQDFVD